MSSMMILQLRKKSCLYVLAERSKDAAISKQREKERIYL